MKDEAAQALTGLRDLVAALRGENGCPWDRKQTPESMRVYLVEEMYELLEAMDSGMPRHVCEELGDVLFQIVFLARIFQERGDFDIADVARGTTDKMTARHPHVFGDEKARTAEDVRAKWHEYKKRENGPAGDRGFLDSVPKSLPALMRAYRIVERASRVGFHRPDPNQAAQAVDRQWRDFLAALDSRDAQASEAALGDFLLNLSGLARQSGVHPENALSKALDRFIQRFGAMEQALKDQGKNLDEADSEKMEALFSQEP